ncbi:MAG: hypothetical protein K6B67_05785 [Lachnospiraceae bacterium]|nr:hypothetical protein [Lachnospiraceae bacterium]
MAFQMTDDQIAELCGAIIQQTLKDLASKNEQVKGEAQVFLDSPWFEELAMTEANASFIRANTGTALCNRARGGVA